MSLAFPRQRARRLGVRDGQSATLTVIQRFGGALNLNIHFQTLVLDGVFNTSGPEGVRFHPTPPPSNAEVARLLTTIRARIPRRLGRRGLGPIRRDCGPVQASKPGPASPNCAGQDDDVIETFSQVRGPFSMLLHSPGLAQHVLGIVNYYRSDSVVEQKLRWPSWWRRASAKAPTYGPPRPRPPGAPACARRRST